MTARYTLTVDQLPLSARAKELVGALARKACAAIDAGEEEDMCIYLCNSENEVIMPVDPAPNMGSQDAKERLVASIRRDAHTMEADMVIMLSEAWQQPVEITSDAQWNDLKRRYGSISNMPGAFEVLLMRVEIPGRVLGAAARITGQGRPRRCAPLLFADMGSRDPGRVAAGIFDQMLPTQEQIAIVSDTLARAEKLFVAKGVNPHAPIFRHSLLSSLELMLWTVPGHRMTDDRLERLVSAAIAVIEK